MQSSLPCLNCRKDPSPRLSPVSSDWTHDVVSPYSVSQEIYSRPSVLSSQSKIDASRQQTSSSIRQDTIRSPVSLSFMSLYIDEYISFRKTVSPTSQSLVIQIVRTLSKEKRRSWASSRNLYMIMTVCPFRTVLYPVLKSVCRSFVDGPYHTYMTS